MIKTVCVSCKWHNGASADAPWHKHLCGNPETQRQKEIDPVTGKERFTDKNDLGRVIFVEEQFPYCRDINHGNCPGYKERGKVKNE